MRNTCTPLVVTYTWICRCSNRLFAVSVAFSATRTGRPTFLSGFYANTPTASASCSRSRTDSGPSVWKKKTTVTDCMRFLAFQRYSRNTSPRTNHKNSPQYFQKNREWHNRPVCYFIFHKLRYLLVFLAVVCTVNARTANKMSTERNKSRLKPMFVNQ